MILLFALSGCSAVGSALDWGSRGREFKSRHSDQKYRIAIWLFCIFLSSKVARLEKEGA